MRRTAGSAPPRPREILLPVGVAVLGTTVATGGMAIAGLTVALMFAIPAGFISLFAAWLIEMRLPSPAVGVSALLRCGYWIAAGAIQYFLNAGLTVAWTGSAPAFSSYNLLFFLPTFLAIATTLVRAIWTQLQAHRPY